MLKTENVLAVNKGCENLKRHLENMAKFGVPIAVAINRFVTDTDAEMQEVMKARREPRRAAPSFAPHWADGGAGTEALARHIVELADGGRSAFKPLYPDGMTLRDKVKTIATEIYRASDIACDAVVPKPRSRTSEAGGFGKSAGVHGEDAVLVLDRPQQARRARGSHRAGSRAAPVGGSRVRRRRYRRDQ